MSVSYGQKTLTPGTVTQYAISSNSGWAIIQNESPYNLQCAIDGTGSTRSIPAQCMDKITIPRNSGFNGNIVLMPVNLLANSASAPSFAVLLDAYGINEEPTGTYPVALMRAVQVGGAVSTVTTQANTLLNTGNAPATTWLTIQPSDAASVLITSDTSGNLTWKGDNAGTLTQLLQLIAGASAKVVLAATGILTEIVGSLQVDQNVVITGTQSTGALTLTNGGVVTGGDWNLGTHGITAAGLIVSTNFQSGNYHDSSGNDGMVISAGATTRIQSAGQVVIQVPGGSSQLTVNSTDILCQLQITAPKYILSGAAQYNGYVGSWSRISTGTFTSATSAHTVNHNLGAAPTNVLGVGGSSTGTTTQGADTYGATTFTTIEFAAGVTMRFRAERA